MCTWWLPFLYSTSVMPLWCHAGPAEIKKALVDETQIAIDYKIDTDTSGPCGHICRVTA